MLSISTGLRITEFKFFLRISEIFSATDVERIFAHMTTRTKK